MGGEEEEVVVVKASTLGGGGVGEETGKKGMRSGGAEGSKRVWMRGRWKG